MRIRTGLLLLAALLLVQISANAATCNFEVPVITIAPHSQGGFTWGNGVRPQGDPCIYALGIDPLNDSAWYAGGSNGLYVTKTNGLFWTKPLSGNVGVIYMDNTNHLVYVGVMNQLYLSRDRGQTWNVIGTFRTTVRSVLVVGSTLYVGLHWGTHAVPSGLYRSSLGGGSWTFLPFGAGHTGLIVWSILYDQSCDAIYAGTEIYDHQPVPYVPKFFRTLNGGATWTNLQGIMKNHVIAMAMRPTDGYLYAMNEAAGVYGSTTSGSSWIPPTSPMGVGGSMLMDPQVTTRLFGGRQRSGLTIGDGGIWVSDDAGKSFTAIGLPGTTIAQLSFNGTRTKLYAAAYASGIYTATMP